MSFKNFVLVVLASLMSPFTWAQSRTSFSYDNLEVLIKRNDIKTVDQLLPMIPAQLRKNAIFVYDTMALNPHLVSPETPRVILFNEDGSLAFTFTRYPGTDSIAQGQDVVEVLSFDQITARYETRELVFDGKRNPMMAGVTVNDPKCTACHGLNPRPLIRNYNSWPGFFGSFSEVGISFEGTPEYGYVDRFLKTHSKAPRYETLDYSGFKIVKGSYRNASFNLQLPLDSQDRGFSPVMIFSALTQERMYERLARRIYEHPSYPEVRSIIGYFGAPNTLIQCGPIRSRFRVIYGELIKKNPLARENGEQVLAKIRTQVTIDSEQSKRHFDRFNVADLVGDERGILNLMNEVLVSEAYDPYYLIDRSAFEAQLIFIETIAKKLNLKSEDITTQHVHLTNGVFHADSNLYEDEQYFQGIYRYLGKLDSALHQELAEDICPLRREKVVNDLLKLEIPDGSAPGVLYHRLTK